MVSVNGSSTSNSTQRLNTSAIPMQIEHSYNTRLQSRLNNVQPPAMNDVTMQEHLSEGIESDLSLTPRPRLSESRNLTGYQSKNDFQSSSESDVEFNAESESESESESDFSCSSSADNSLYSEKSLALEDDQQLESVHDSESEELSLASSEGSGEASEAIAYNFLGAIQRLMGVEVQSDYFESIQDKTSYLKSVGIDFSAKSETVIPKEQIEQSDEFWSKFRDFTLDQFNLILNLDTFSVSKTMANIHTDSRIESDQKNKILTSCNKLLKVIHTFKGIEKEFQLSAPERNARGVENHNILPINAGTLAKGIAVLTKAQTLLQEVGFSLPIQNIEVAMKSGLKIHSNTAHSTVTFKDVLGINEAKVELEEIVAFLKTPDNFTKLGAKIPRGVLLSGQPGTGKTLLAKAVAGEAGVPFFSVSGSAFVEEYVGVGAKRVRELFHKANSHDACIIFIDEIDAVGGKRSARSDGGGQEHNQTLNQLLTEMDGFKGSSGVIVMAATNRPDALDSALKRPGRFDRNIHIPLPDVSGREGILKHHAANKQLAASVDFKALARQTRGYAGADLANLVNEAALLAGRAGKNAIEHVDFQAAYDKVTMGLPISSSTMSETNRKRVAYHEAGHAIVSYLQGLETVYKVTIEPRGNSLGATHYLPNEDTTALTFAELKAALCSLMGGRLAEEILFGKEGITTGPSNDLKVASNIARKMITEWGFSEKIGRVAFVGEDGAVAAMSSKTAESIDQEVQALISEAEKTARDLLLNNRDKLDSMSMALLAKETIDQDDIRQIMSRPYQASNDVQMFRANAADMLL